MQETGTRRKTEAFDLGLQMADLFILPIKDVPAHQVPGDPVGKADGDLV